MRHKDTEGIVAINTKSGLVTVQEERDDAQLTLLIAISAFGNSAYPFSFPKSKHSREHYARQRNQMRAMISQFDQPQRLSSQIFTLSTGSSQYFAAYYRMPGKIANNGPMILVVDERSTHLTPRVNALCGIRKIIFIQLVPHSSHLAKSLDLCVLGLFKIIS
jgi:hypothetical protein